MPCGGRRSGLLGQGFQILGSVSLFMGDDGFVGVGYQHPLTGAQFFWLAIQPRLGGTALLHDARIHGVPRHPVDGGVGKVGLAVDLMLVVVVVAGEPLVLAGAGDKSPFRIFIVHSQKPLFL